MMFRHVLCARNVVWILGKLSGNDEYSILPSQRQYIHIFDLMPTRAHSLYNIMILCFMLIFELLLRSNKLSCRSTGKRWNVEFVIIWFLSIFQKLVKYLTKAHQISHFSISHSTIHKKHRKKCKLCKFCKLCKLCCR